MSLSADASSDPLGGIQFGEVVTGALDLGASECRPGALLQTGALLDALARIDVHGNWTRIWLHTGIPENLHLVDIQDEPGGDRSQVEQIRWAGVPLSASLVEAFKILQRLAKINSMSVVLPGTLGLALVAKPTFGATRALLAGGGINHAQLLDLVQTELLGTTLKGIEGLIFEKPLPINLQAPKKAVWEIQWGRSMRMIFWCHRMNNQDCQLSVVCKSSEVTYRSLLV